MEAGDLPGLNWKWRLAWVLSLVVELIPRHRPDILFFGDFLPLAIVFSGRLKNNLSEISSMSGSRRRISVHPLVESR
jgi:hypothetical protein